MVAARAGARLAEGGAGEVELDRGQHQPGGVSGEFARRQVRQGTVFEVGDDLLDDRVVPVGFVGAHCVQGAGGEERVEPARVEQGGLPGASRSRRPMMTGADDVVETMPINAFSPRTPECP